MVNCGFEKFGIAQWELVAVPIHLHFSDLRHARRLRLFLGSFHVLPENGGRISS